MLRELLMRSAYREMSRCLAENLEGITFDHALLRERSPGDTRLLEESTTRLEALGIGPVMGIGTDRGFASRANRRLLEEKDIFDATCPRDPAELTRRHRQDELFAACQRRRAQTEARVGILKNHFLSGQFRARGYERRAAAVDWAVLAHNLRVIARLQRAKAKPDTAQDPPQVRAAAKAASRQTANAPRRPSRAQARVPKLQPRRPQPPNPTSRNRSATKNRSQRQQKPHPPPSARA